MTLFRKIILKYSQINRSKWPAKHSLTFWNGIYWGRLRQKWQQACISTTAHHTEVQHIGIQLEQTLDSQKTELEPNNHMTLQKLWPPALFYHPSIPCLGSTSPFPGLIMGLGSVISRWFPDLFHHLSIPLSRNSRGFLKINIISITLKFVGNSESQAPIWTY